VDLDVAQAVSIPAGSGELEFDWGDMTTTSLQKEYDPFTVTEAVVAHYPMTRAQLQARFLDLRELADGWWSTESIAGTSVELGTLTAEDGSTFSGIDDDGLWLVALFCTEACNNPAPLSITFLEPCP
jgi:hypothetical protein